MIPARICDELLCGQGKVRGRTDASNDNASSPERGKTYKLDAYISTNTKLIVVWFEESFWHCTSTYIYVVNDLKLTTGAYESRVVDNMTPVRRTTYSVWNWHALFKIAQTFKCFDLHFLRQMTRSQFDNSQNISQFLLSSMLYVVRGACPPWIHDDVIKWKHFPRYWPFVRGIHRSLVNSPHKGKWSGTLMFSLICAWIKGWVNNAEAGDLRHHRAYYVVTVKIETYSSMWRYVTLFLMSKYAQQMLL